MPDSSTSRFSFSQLRKIRTIKVVLCLVFITPLLWLLYSKSVDILSSHGEDGDGKTPRKGTNVSQDTSTAGEIHERKSLWGTEFVKGSGNFEPPYERRRSGPGEEGRPHKLHSYQDFPARVTQQKYGMNMVCSDGISLDRSIPDLRLPECKHWNYPEHLPNASVVVVFHNEGFSTLMRTVHSVINRTPPQFLSEVLLVDDYSDRDDLKGKLESYIQRWHGKVRLIRNKEREGLINTRSKGAREALGEVIVFLDAHCEVNKNWLPPLLAPIYKNRTTMTVPIVDGIESTDFEVRSVYEKGHHFKGIFEWGMLYKEKELSDKEIKARAHNSEPYKSPTHAGGLFAINREYFLHIGAYDPGLLIWGGENFELSFKIWQCGGSIFWVPCSRVAHVYKSSMSYGLGTLKRKANGPITTINYKRVVETWMDNKYKEHFYTREPMARFMDMGDISEQLKLKEKLQCKSFQWYMDNVAYDLTSKFPEPPPNIHWGEMENVGSRHCVDTLGRQAPTRLSVLPCSHSFSSDQLVRLNAKGQLGIGERCVDTDSHGVKLDYCKLGSVSGPWRYNEVTNIIYHVTTKKCLAIDHGTAQLSLLWCDPVSPYQQWKFNEVHL